MSYMALAPRDVFSAWILMCVCARAHVCLVRLLLVAQCKNNNIFCQLGLPSSIRSGFVLFLLASSFLMDLHIVLFSLPRVFPFTLQSASIHCFWVAIDAPLCSWVWVIVSLIPRVRAHSRKGVEPSDNPSACKARIRLPAHQRLLSTCCTFLAIEK